MSENKVGLVHAHFFIVAGLIWLKLLLLRILFFDRISWEWIAADIAPVLLIMGILALIVPGRMKTAVYWSFNGILSLLLFASSVYFNHFGSVPTYLAFYELNQVFEVKRAWNRPSSTLITCFCRYCNHDSVRLDPQMAERYSLPGAELAVSPWAESPTDRHSRRDYRRRFAVGLLRTCGKGNHQ